MHGLEQIHAVLGQYLVAVAIGVWVTSVGLDHRDRAGIQPLQGEQPVHHRGGVRRLGIGGVEGATELLLHDFASNR